MENRSLVKELEKYGLVKNGKILMDESDLTALKRGNMTDLIELKNLSGNGFEIDSLKARLSIVNDGKTKKLRTDPIYKEVQNHSLLESHERDALVKGKVANIKKTSLIIEYDPHTRQFIDYDPRKMKTYEQINGETLSVEKKKRLREGEVISIADGTQVQICTSDKNGLRSNRSSIVLSILTDIGLSHLLVKGITHLIGVKSQDADSYSQGFLDGLREVKKQLKYKQKQFPNDISIANEINTVQELIKKHTQDIKEEKNIGESYHGKDYDEYFEQSRSRK